MIHFFPTTNTREDPVPDLFGHTWRLPSRSRCSRESSLKLDMPLNFVRLLGCSQIPDIPFTRLIESSAQPGTVSLVTSDTRLFSGNNQEQKMLLHSHFAVSPLLILFFLHDLSFQIPIYIFTLALHGNQLGVFTFKRRSTTTRRYTHPFCCPRLVSSMEFIAACKSTTSSSSWSPFVLSKILRCVTQWKTTFHRWKSAGKERIAKKFKNWLVSLLLMRFFRRLFSPQKSIRKCICSPSTNSFAQIQSTHMPQGSPKN